MSNHIEISGIIRKLDLASKIMYLETTYNSMIVQKLNNLTLLQCIQAMGITDGTVTLIYDAHSGALEGIILLTKPVENVEHEIEIHNEDNLGISNIDDQLKESVIKNADQTERLPR